MKMLIEAMQHHGHNIVCCLSNGGEQGASDRLTVRGKDVALPKVLEDFQVTEESTDSEEIEEGKLVRRQTFSNLPHAGEPLIKKKRTRILHDGLINRALIHTHYACKIW